MSTTRGNPRTYATDVRTDERGGSPVDISPVRYAHEQDQDSRPEICTRRSEAVVFTTCTCGPCADRRRKTQKRQRTKRLPRVPSSEAWKVLDALQARGLGRRAICSAIPGVPNLGDALDLRARSGHMQNFGRTYAARIVAAGPGAKPATGLVDATGATRRLRALSRMGHDMRQIEQATGINRNRLAYVRRGQPRTQVDVVDAVAAAYERLAMVDGGSAVTRNIAERAGWPPPLAWDNIDDPAETPAPPAQPGPRQRRHPGKPVEWDALRWEDVDRLRSYGVADEQIAERFNVSLSALEKAEHRYGRRAAGTPAA